MERVGAILNSSTSLTRDDVLQGLDETDQGFANAVRKAIFTFANIPQRITPRDIPRVLRVVEQAQLVTAFSGAEAAGVSDVVEFILENMPGRMADQLREEVAEAGTVKPTDAEAAMNAIVAAIRELEREGELQLITPEESD